MLAKKMEKALNEQVEKEANASQVYLAMASWCETQSLEGCAAFFYQQAEEEREHMMKIFRYINERGGHAIAPKVKQPPLSYKTIKAAFETSLSYEEENTAAINRLVELAQQIKGHATFQMLQWFIGEQVEEEGLFQRLIHMAKMAGTDGRGLMMLDHALRSIRVQNGEKQNSDL